MQLAFKVLGAITGAIIGALLFLVKTIITLPFKIGKGIYKLIKYKKQRKQEVLAEEMQNQRPQLTVYEREDNEDLEEEFRQFQEFKAWQRERELQSNSINELQNKAAELRRLAAERKHPPKDNVISL